MTLRKKIFHTTALIACLAALSACKAQTSSDGQSSTSSIAQASSPTMSIDFEKYTLDNGLDVVLHIDRSDPVVAINIAAHVGSARETEGRTGFAHLFEHLLFLDSENLKYGGLDEMNTRIGGEGTNGFTTHDMTQYFQAVPKDALEKVIWAEADKLCCFIKTVSQNVIDNEKQVVKNEKRQRVDNQPYGHNLYIVNKALYPEDHPYNWQVIGSLADLDAASLKDTQDFYKRWYVPNNVTLTLTGDFDMVEAKSLINKYFGDIPRGDAIEPYKARPSNLSETKSLYHEDSFATVPQLTLVWPSVPQYHPDSYALNILLEYLTDGKRAPMSEVLVDEEKLTSSVSAFNYAKEISGESYVFVTANEGQDLDPIIPAIGKAFERFESNGISQADLDRIKAGLEVSFYNGMQSALGKAISLSEYNLFTDDPGFISKDIAGMQGVSTDDVMRVYTQYIKDKPHLLTSFVPTGKLDLALEGSSKAEVVEEKVVAGEGAPVDFDPAARIIANPTPSGFDRTIEPDFGDSYTLPSPNVWRDSLSNGIDIYGMHSDETPLIYFSLKIDAGNSRGDYAKPAIPDMVSAMLKKGTANKTTAELEDAIKSLGSSISISTSSNGTYITGNTLARNFDATMALAQEMLLEPRWDAEEFDLLKRKLASDIDQAAANPNAVASREMSKLRYPEGHILRYAYFGPKDKLETVTLEDLKAFYETNYTQNNAVLRIVGDIKKTGVKSAMRPLSKGWDKPAPANKKLAEPAPVSESKIYFYDIPGAKQSVLRMERQSMTALDPNYPLGGAINFPLGGIYTSKLNTELRVNKGYTYGIRSGFSGDKDRGFFTVSSSVRTNVTKESLELINQIVSDYGPDFTEDDLVGLKDALSRGQALKNETLSDKLSMLNQISAYGYPVDYKAKNSAKIQAMSLEDFKAIAKDNLRPDAMRYLVVGDAASQADGLKALGFGDPVMLEVQK